MPLISLERYSRELLAGPRHDFGDVCEFHHDGRTCYWRYNSFNASDDAKKAIDAVFKGIKGNASWRHYKACPRKRGHGTPA